jgi:ATP-dependent DNA helicase RecG
MCRTCTPQAPRKLPIKSGLSKDQVQILDKCLHDSQIGELMALAGRTNRTKFRDQVLNPLLEAGFIEMTVPEKPNSSKQRYRTTAAGRTVFANSKKEPQV